MTQPTQRQLEFRMVLTWLAAMAFFFLLGMVLEGVCLR